MGLPIKEIPRLSEEDEARFWGNVKLTANPTKCWEWSALKFVSGYGRFSLKGKSYRASRVAYSQVYGNPEGDKPLVCHSCDNPACCNPNHLFVGSSKDNSRDMVGKGRANSPTGDRHKSRTCPESIRRGDRHPSRMYPEKRMRGEAHAMSKLDSKAVTEIRERYAAGGISMKKLSEKFNVCPMSICLIVNRKIWKHVA